MMCFDCVFEVMKCLLEGKIKPEEVLRAYDFCNHRCYLKDCSKITVYLSDAFDNKSGDGYDLTLDFYTYLDYLRFQDYSGGLNEYSFSINVERARLSTFILVSGFKAETKYPRGHYILNLDVLFERWHREADDVSITNDNETDRPDFYISRFSKKKERTDKGKDLPLLSPIVPQVYPEWVFMNVMRQPQLRSPNTNVFKLKINNVGQGNWNEILADDKPYLMFDIGTNAFGKDIAQGIQHQLQKHPIKDDIDALFISHWHEDHYNILTGMNMAELNHIKQLVCTSSVYNLTAFNIIMLFNLRANSTLCVIQHPIGKKWNEIKGIGNNVKLYARRFVKNPNNAGLLLFFYNQQRCLTLTGDAYYSTVEQVTNDAISKLKCRGDYYMVVPHHGGRAGKFTCNINARVKKHAAIISVGAAKNYGHPSSSVEDSLRNSFQILLETKNVSTDIIYNL